MRILALSDIHQQIPALARFRGTVEPADLLLVLGDLTQFGGRDEARSVLTACRGLAGRILAVPGNLDRPAVLDLLVEEGVCLHGTGISIGDLGLAGVGGSNPTPMHTPFELEEKELERLLEDGLSAIADCPRRILVSHAPPQGTAVDRIRSGLHVGSPAVRKAAESHAPDLLLCGHIHEAAGEALLGGTRVINPGPLSAGGYILIQDGPEGLEARLDRF